MDTHPRFKVPQLDGEPPLDSDEVWKQYKDTIYFGSNKGRIKNSVSGLILKTSVNIKGAVHFSLYHNKVSKLTYVHRVVADLFLENPYNKKFIKHKDGNKSNNTPENLKWTDSDEHIVDTVDNTDNRRINGAIKYRLTEEQVREIARYIGMDKYSSEYKTSTQLAKEYNVCPSTIKNIWSGKRWKSLNLEIPPMVHPLAKLKKDDIPTIKKMLSEGTSGAKIGKQFNVNRATISKISLGKNWKGI